MLQQVPKHTSISQAGDVLTAKMLQLIGVQAEEDHLAAQVKSTQRKQSQLRSRQQAASKADKVNQARDLRCAQDDLVAMLARVILNVAAADLLIAMGLQMHPQRTPGLPNRL